MQVWQVILSLVMTGLFALFFETLRAMYDTGKKYLGDDYHGKGKN